MNIYLYPYRESAHGNIIWANRDQGSAYCPVSRFAARNGRFPKDHPVAPNGSAYGGNAAQIGTSDVLTKFRERGYWASCFPEGDGITWQPINGQDDDQCLRDIRECFGWPDVKWSKF